MVFFYFLLTRRLVRFPFGLWGGGQMIVLERLGWAWPRVPPPLGSAYVRTPRASLHTSLYRYPTARPPPLPAFQRRPIHIVRLGRELVPYMKT